MNHSAEGSTGGDAMPSPEHLPPATVERVANAVVPPMEPGRDMPHGVFRRDGTFCAASRTLISAGRFSGVPNHPAPAETQRLEGRYLYAGVGRHHFGHFLMEGLGRLWALDHVETQVDGILVVPMHDKDIETVLRRRFLPFYTWLCDARPIWLIDRPVQVDDLLLPSQGFGHRHWSVGTPEFRDFVRSRVAARITPDGPRWVYVSRTQLKSPDHRMDREDALERTLVEKGYVVFHPEQYTIEEQLQVYMSADRILGADGSAFHLAPFAMRPGTRLGLIQRRHRQAPFDALVAQIRAFVDVDLVTFNALRPRDTHPTPRGEPDAIRFKGLLQDLKSAGFI